MASMSAIEAHPELADVPEPARGRLLALFDVMHVGGSFDPPDPPAVPCDCEAAGGRPCEGNATVSILDTHAECPYCRGLIGSDDIHD